MSKLVSNRKAGTGLYHVEEIGDDGQIHTIGLIRLTPVRTWFGMTRDGDITTGEYATAKGAAQGLAVAVAAGADMARKAAARVAMMAEAEARLDAIAARFTAYPNFRTLCQNNPTLRTDRRTCPTLQAQDDMALLRAAYYLATGRQAAK